MGAPASPDDHASSSSSSARPDSLQAVVHSAASISPGISVERYRDPVRHHRTPAAAVEPLLSGEATAALPTSLELPEIFASHWSRIIYNDSYDAIFGSWMGKFGCPFLSVTMLEHLQTFDHAG